MNRERKNSETQVQYHQNMKAWQATIKQHLAGRYVHVSTTNPPTRGEGRTYRRNTK